VKPVTQVATAVAAIPALLGVLALLVLTASLVSWEPFWSEPSLTMAEAAALNDRATIQRLIWNGSDPNAPARVRTPILKSTEIVVTPLEASVGTRTPTTLQFLLARGARMDSHERDVIFCLAAKDEAQEIIEFLQKDGVNQKPDCQHVATPW
jgi:hypothetical protein